MKEFALSNLALLYIFLFLLGINAENNQIFDSNSSLLCSSLVSLSESEEMMVEYNINTAIIREKLTQRLDLAQKLQQEGISYFSDLLSELKEFVWSDLKFILYASIIIIACLLVIHRAQKIGQMAFFRERPSLLPKISIKVQIGATFILVICAILILSESVRAIIVVNNQQSHFSQVACLLKTEPKLRLNEGKNQNYLTLSNILQLLQPHQIIQVQHFNQLSIFLNHRLDIYQNLRLAQYIRNTSISLTTEQQYIQQLDNLIIDLDRMTAASVAYDAYQIRMRLRTNYTGHTDTIRALKAIHSKIQRDIGNNIIYELQIIFLIVCIVIGSTLLYLVIKTEWEKSQRDEDRYIFNKVFLVSLYAFIFLLIIFSLISLNIAGIYWFNNGIAKQTDKLSTRLTSLYTFGEVIERLIPNSRERRKIRYQEIITKSQHYQKLLNPIADKSNNHYYNLFKQSLSFLNEPQRSKVQSKLQLKCIKESQLVPQSKIARDAFRRMIATCDENSILDRIQFSDYGVYLTQLFGKLEKAVFVNLYALRTHIGRLLSAFLVIYLLSYVGNRNYSELKQINQQQSKINSRQKQPSLQAQNLTQDDSDQFITN